MLLSPIWWFTLWGNFEFFKECLHEFIYGCAYHVCRHSLGRLLDIYSVFMYLLYMGAHLISFLYISLICLVFISFSAMPYKTNYKVSSFIIVYFYCIIVYFQTFYGFQINQSLSNARNDGYIGKKLCVVESNYLDITIKFYIKNFLLAMLGKKDLFDAGNDLLTARQQIFGTLIGQTILIYIQERVGFSLGYGIPTVGLIIFPLIFLIHREGSVLLNFEG